MNLLFALFPLDYIACTEGSSRGCCVQGLVLCSIKRGGKESRDQEDSGVFCCLLLSVVLKADCSPPSDHSCSYSLHIVAAVVTQHCLHTRLFMYRHWTGDRL